MKKRLFLALGATEMAAAAQVYMKKLKINFGDREIEVQWVPPTNWHITLVFLGSTETEKIPEIESRVQKVCDQFQDFKLRISDFGAFPEAQAARVVWAGVQRSQALLNLQGEIESALADLGFAPESRDYWPHLTLGRLRNHKNITDALSPVVRKEIGSLKVHEVRLYESTLAAPYPRYEVLKTFFLQSKPLTRTSSD